MTQITSKISLSNPKSVKVNDSGLSRAYFCLTDHASVSKEVVNDLKKISADLGHKSVRICLHPGVDSRLQDMVVLIPKSQYFAPHKHLDRSESYHLIEGEAALFMFDEAGAVLECTVLNSSGTFLYRTRGDQFHALVPLSDQLIYHEARQGPFVPSGDSIFPDWAPHRDNSDQGLLFLKKLVWEHLKIKV